MTVFGKIRSFLSAALTGRPAMAAVVIFGFLSGYNGVSSYSNMCFAQAMVPPGPPVSVGGGMCICCTTPPCPQPCDPSGTAQTVYQTAYNMTNTALQIAAQTLENWLGSHVDWMMQALLTRLNEVEMNMIRGFQTMWGYNLRPGLQSMTEQLNVATADQAKTYQSSMDAEHETQNNMVIMKSEVETHSVMQENVCPPAGLSPGRAAVFSDKVPEIMEDKANAVGSNKVGSTSAPGPGAHLKYRIDTYENIFCNPDDNGGENTCGTSDPDFYNADVKVTEVVMNSLTIPVGDDEDGKKYEKAVEEITENLLNSTAAEPTDSRASDAAPVQQRIMERRSYLARHNATRAVTQKIIGWRMPGSNLGEWISEIREEAGIPAEEVGENPSYREVMHALSIDRFNSGTYANSMIKEAAGVEMEKLAISAFHLMQLRDYHELLERMALVLAVQVAIRADATPVPSLEQIQKVQ